MCASSLLPAALSLLCFCSASAFSPKDTAHLANRLQSVRGQMWLAPREYRAFQAEYLAWLDVRLKAGESPENMNRELQAAGLFPAWPDIPDEMFNSHAGYLEEIKERQVQGATDVFVIEAGIYKGGGCSNDVTALLYERGSFARLAKINAAPGRPEYAYHLSGLDVSGKDATGRRLVATGWAISNCTSSWNGKYMRIDQVNGSQLQNVLAHRLFARDRDPEDDVAVQLQGDVVTFRYDGGVHDSELMATPSVARYRVIGRHAVRQVPVALTRAGFISEWLSMTDADPSRWAEPPALRMRKTVAAAVEKHGIAWADIAVSGGSPPIWEVAVHVDDTDQLYVFHISGARATDLRMLNIDDKLTPSGTLQDLDPATLGEELPW